jgi:ABC-2 type transport system ATP-binding protein
MDVDRVTKRYGQVAAVSDVSFQIEPGVTGLLGPNGAGKTTLLKMMAGLLEPTSGSVHLFGQSLRRHPQLYRRLGYCPESERLYDYMTGGEFLQFSAELQQLKDPEDAAHQALEQVDLLKEKDKKIRAYSRGMRQRLKVAQSLLHDPELLLFDEPLKGADPTQRRILIDLIRRLGEAGKTIVVSSHVLHEVERMASQIILLHRGRLLALGDFRAIRELMDDRPHKVALKASDPPRLAAALTEKALVSGVSLSGEELVVDVSEPELFYSKFPQVALETGVRITQLVSLDDDLESVFRYLVR